MKIRRKQIFFFIKILLGLTGFVFLNTANSLECNPDGSQQEMNQCALDNFEQADLELNQVYQQLLENSNSSFVKNLRIAQRAWIVFRNSELEAMFACNDENKRICWGTMYGLQYPAAKEALTRNRIQQLRQHLDQME
ncbi:MAG: DUF1311 domain-containing protein [Methylococcales bacterium]|nr:DUF1311 domain-containing protein [Methylococcales bacterium]